MKEFKSLGIIILLALFAFNLSCEKELSDEVKKSAVLAYKYDVDSNQVFYFADCEELNIDTLIVTNGLYLTFTGCGDTVKYFSKPSWHYNCYPVYDYWGYYLYDDCYWEYYTSFDINTDSLVYTN